MPVGRARRTNRALLVVTLALLQSPGSLAADRESPDDRWWHLLVPKAFQANPRLELTAITEFTEAGRQRPDVSPATPALYEAHALGFRNQGDAIQTTPLSRADIETVLVRSLARNGFIRATEFQQPELAIIYLWGAHNRYDPEVSPVSTDVLVRSVLDRAALVGGTKFAAELARAYRRTELLAAASPKRLETLSGELQGAPVGIALGMMQMNGLMNPVRLFAMRDAKTQRLLDQAADDCYFVVASVYDYSSVARNEPQLLWRTRLTVSARGVSQEQSLPHLIASGAPYFGREMEEAVTMKTRPVRPGDVEIGTAIVIP